MTDDVVMEGGIGFFGELLGLSGVCDGRGLGSAISTSTDVSDPLSTATVLGSAASSPSVTPERSSYKIGENLTATLAFLCPGSRAIGGRAKLAREYMYTDEGELCEKVSPDGWPFLPRVVCSSTALDEGTTVGSSNCPAGVRSNPPSGLKVSRLKKFV